MSKLKKFFSTLHRKMIFLWDGINNKKFTKKYVKWLKKRGVIFNGTPDYICSDAYIDGTGYNKIRIGDKVVISKGVVLLTHDFSIRTGVLSTGMSFEECKNYHYEKPIKIGNNVFIGVRTIVLPGTNIGDNVIIGSGSVIKGNIEANSVYFGNPAKRICSINDWAEKHAEDDFIR